MRRSITMLLATLAVAAPVPALGRTAPFVLHSNQEDEQQIGIPPAAEGDAVQLVSVAPGQPGTLPPSFWASYVGGGTATAAPPGPGGGLIQWVPDPDEHGNSPALRGDSGFEQGPVIRPAALPAPGALWLLATAALCMGRRRR